MSIMNSQTYCLLPQLKKRNCVKELLDDENFSKTSKRLLIRAVKVAVFSGDGRGVALQTRKYPVLSYRKSCRKKYF